MVNCVDERIKSNAEWSRALTRKLMDRRIPISGMLELTSRCNLRCVHCYLGPQEEQHKKRDQEMSTEEVYKVIDELFDAGCLYLAITGGDPMMRKDFPDIYRYSKLKGIYTTVFCDGVLINDKYIELFKELPPHKVEISLYGATRETYEKITRIKGSYDKCIRGINMVLAAGIKLELKTVLMEPNKHELEMMRQMAEGWGVNFRFDGAIFPCLPNSEKEPLDLRVEPVEVVWKEMSHEPTRQDWKNLYEQKKNIPSSTDMYVCGAGTTGFYIDPFSNLSPCVMTTKYKYSLKSNGFDFQKVWDTDVVKMRQLKARAEHECNTCELRGICSGCAAFNFLENGEEDKKSEYVCEITRLRHEAISSDAPMVKPVSLKLSMKTKPKTNEGVHS